MNWYYNEVVPELGGSAEDIEEAYDWNACHQNPPQTPAAPAFKPVPIKPLRLSSNRRR